MFHKKRLSSLAQSFKLVLQWGEGQLWDLQVRCRSVMTQRRKFFVSASHLPPSLLTSSLCYKETLGQVGRLPGLGHRIIDGSAVWCNRGSAYADLDKTLKLTATRYLYAKPQDQGCHSKPKLIGNWLRKHHFCVVLTWKPFKYLNLRNMPDDNWHATAK